MEEKVENRTKDEDPKEQKKSIDQNVSFKNILKITYPVILSMFSLNLMVFADRAFVAKYSLTQFAATLPASNLSTTIASIFMGIIGFASSLISQYYGAKKYKDCSAAMWQGVYLSIAFSVLLLLLSTVASNIFKVMGHTGELLQYERQYFSLIIISSCIQLFSTAFSGLYRGIGNTLTTMFVGFTANIFNILLDWVFIYGKFGIPEMGGILGSGLATVISCAIGLTINIFLLNKKIFRSEYKIFTNWKMDRALVYKLFKFGFPAGIQAFVGTGYYSLLLLIIGKTGEFNMSCSNIAFTIEGISIFPVWGLGAAVSIIAAQERGAGRVDNVIKVAKRGVFIGFCFSLLIIAVFNIFPELLVSIFRSGDEKEKFLLIRNCTMPLIRLTSLWIVFDTVQIVVGNVLRAVGDTVFMMITYLIMPFVFYIVLPYILCVVFGVSLVWIWVELVVFTLGMFAVVLTRFYSGKWKKIDMI